MWRVGGWGALWSAPLVGGRTCVAPDAFDPICFERHQPVWRPLFFLSPSDLLIYTLDICIRHPCGLLPSKTSLKTKLRCTATKEAVSTEHGSCLFPFQAHSCPSGSAICKPPIPAGVECGLFFGGPKALCFTPLHLSFVVFSRPVRKGGTMKG